MSGKHDIDVKIEWWCFTIVYMSCRHDIVSNNRLMRYSLLHPSTSYNHNIVTKIEWGSLLCSCMSSKHNIVTKIESIFSHVCVLDRHDIVTKYRMMRYSLLRPRILCHISHSIQVNSLSLHVCCRAQASVHATGLLLVLSLIVFVKSITLLQSK
jgi:hypothetical protein